MTLRQEKVSFRIREIAGEFLNKETDRSSLITVTKVTITSDLKKSEILITVFPENKEVKALYEIRPGKFREFAKKKLKTKFLPYFEFRLDENEKKKRKIEELLKK